MKNTPDSMPAATAGRFTVASRPKGWTALDNRAVLDARLSLKAKGLLLVMMSRPPGWTFHMGWIEAQSADGREATRSAMKELRTLGYVVRFRARNEETGTFDGWAYVVDDQPQDRPEDDGPDDTSTERRETRQSGNPSDGKPATNKTEGNKTDLSKTGKAVAGATRSNPPRNLKLEPEGKPGKAEGTPSQVKGSPAGRQARKAKPEGVQDVPGRAAPLPTTRRKAPAEKDPQAVAVKALKDALTPRLYAQLLKEKTRADRSKWAALPGVLGMIEAAPGKTELIRALDAAVQGAQDAAMTAAPTAAQADLAGGWL